MLRAYVKESERVCELLLCEMISRTLRDFIVNELGSLSDVRACVCVCMHLCVCVCLCVICVCVVCALCVRVYGRVW